MKRAIFVDDDKRLLDGLRRGLRAMGKNWDLVFVTSGDDALAAMETAPFDVIVSDMLMPGMTGAELLRHVEQRFPKTIRIILSGETGQALSPDEMQKLVHTQLTKPCRPKDLQAIIEKHFQS